MSASQSSTFATRLERAITALEAAWDDIIDPAADAADRRDRVAPAARIGAVLASFSARMGLPEERWHALLDDNFRPQRKPGQNKPRLDNGTAAWIFAQVFPGGDANEAEDAWLRWTLFDQMVRRYRATLSQFHRADEPWLIPLREKEAKDTPQTFADILARAAEELKEARVAMVTAHNESVVGDLEAAATRGFLPHDDCLATHKQIDDVELRRRRFQALADAPTAMTLENGLRLPFVVQHLPDEYRAAAPGERTFDYEVVRERAHEESWFRLPAEERAIRRARLRELAGSMRTRGAVFDNGQDLAALHSVERDHSRFRFRFHRVTYFDYVMANMMAPLDGDAPLDDPGCSPERIWSRPRGAFFGLSALVVTADDYVVLQIRDGLPAADQMSINASISGGMDFADLDHPHPLEAGLLREGTSEISQLFARGIERGASLTYLGWLRNAHRQYLPELAWLVQLHQTTVEAWLVSGNQDKKNSWRSLSKQSPEAFELADESAPLRGTNEVWMPSLIFVKRHILLDYAAQVLNLASLPDCDPRSAAPVRPWWSFGWLTADGVRRPGQDGERVDIHTTLDRNQKFNDGRWKLAARALGRRQPALPLLSTLALYVTMLQRRGDPGQMEPAR